MYVERLKIPAGMKSQPHWHPYYSCMLNARHGHPRQTYRTASFWQNGFAERLIGSIQRECVDHFIVLGEAHLRHILRTYARYYNHIRTHWSLDKIRRSIAPFSGSDLSIRTRSWADFTITTFAFRFSVHTSAFT